jgi:hypothetical protein
LGKSFQFIKDLLKPNGDFPQFGDNDSGRLFKFEHNNLLNYEALISGFSALHGNTEAPFFEAKFICQLLKGNKLEYKKSSCSLPKIITKHQHQKPITTKIKFSSAIDVDKISFFSYPEFGIFGFKSANFYLVISAISNKNMHHSWGHVHNDKLSFELQVNGKDLVKDPGTYTYSGNPEKRTAFRSGKAHHGIVVKDVEQNKGLGLFYLEREVKCKVLEVKASSITIQASYYGVEHVRQFTVLSNQLLINDYCNMPYRVNINQFELYSPNYGIKKNN